MVTYTMICSSDDDDDDDDSDLMVLFNRIWKIRNCLYSMLYCTELYSMLNQLHSILLYIMDLRII